MKKLQIIPLALIALILMSMKGDKEAYQLFNTKGGKAKYKAMLNDALDADIVFFGELHNNPISHWLQYGLTKDIFEQKGSNLVLGAEMFESDNQLLLDEYLSGSIRDKNFEEEARLWKNYKTDYKPLVEFARENKLNFVATNIPRRYASVVYKKGFEGLDSLSGEAKKYIAPLPVQYDPDLKGYKDMLAGMEEMGGHANPNLPKAQAIKDATMAYFILQNWKAGQTFIHFNGTYHSNNFEGIVWYLKQAKPDLNILTIASVEQDSVDELEEANANLADYILCIPKDMTKTH
ncbi:MAG: ChaN family lipoprotein [Bacteroidales bacterium]|nr:ChaN family lipoprotein [Bacteroidales bacterium]